MCSHMRFVKSCSFEIKNRYYNFKYLYRYIDIPKLMQTTSITYRQIGNFRLFIQIITQLF